MSLPSIRVVQQDWRVLDEFEDVLPQDVRLISHEQFTCCADATVEYIRCNALSRLAGRVSRPLCELLYVVQLLKACTRNTVLIVNGGTRLWLFTGLLNRFCCIRPRCILCWDVFIEVTPGWKQRIMRAAMKGMSLAVLWSRSQIVPHAEFLRMPAERFVFLPFKANHSKGPRYDIPIGNFVFAGGNGKRDYVCLIEAVRDTGIPVIISATDKNVRRQIERLPNVIVLSAAEPSFAQLQAASRFVVIPMTFTGLKGGGEANFCNAMWHGKPVIAADSISASDYVIDGETGYVVPAGDSAALRERIIRLWGDPEAVRRMGIRARQHVENNYTHQLFIRRLLRLALVLGRDCRASQSDE